MTDIERKIQLTKFLREETIRNRTCVRKREEILYGDGKPLFSVHKPSSEYSSFLQDFNDTLPKSNTGSVTYAFRIRSILAALLFGLILYCDRFQITFAQKTARELVEPQLLWSAEGKLIDFMESFPYTLPYE